MKSRSPDKIATHGTLHAREEVMRPGAVDVFPNPFSEKDLPRAIRMALGSNKNIP